MNLRTTAWLFALMLSMLWLFGLMLAFKKNPLDKAYVVPTFQAARDATIDTVIVQRKPEKKEPEEFVFQKEGDVWRFQDKAAGQSAKVEGFRVDQIVSQIKLARKDDEADVSNNPSRFDLAAPRATITLKGQVKTRGAAEAKGKDDDQEEKKDAPAVTKTKEWRFFIGKDSPDKRFVYVNSSDEPERVFAVLKSSLDALFFEDPNHLRSKRLFDFSDATAGSIEIKHGAQELELKRGDDAQWRFVKPSYGIAELEGPPEAKDLPPGLKPPEKTPEGGVKGLLSAIAKIAVDADADFVPLAKDNLTKYRLEDGKELIRIQIGTPGVGDKKDVVTKETLLIGEQERGYYYGRLANDQGVFKLPAKQLEPVLKALKDPGTLRSLDIAAFDPKQIDAVVIKQGGAETKLWHPEGKSWQMQAGAGESKKASEAAVAKLIDALQGKRQIQRYHDEADTKKLDAELGVDSPTVEVTLYVAGLEKADDKKDAKKTDPKDAKKDEKKEDKKDAKADAFNLKKDAKAITLKFGKAGKDTVPVLRVAGTDLPARFVVPKAVLDAVWPTEGALAYLDPALPPFEPGDVVKLDLDRGGRKLEVEKGTGNQAQRWLVKESADPAGQSLADSAKVEQLFRILGKLTAKKLVKRLDAKDNVEEYGLKAPSLTATLQLHPRPAAATIAGVMSALLTTTDLRGLLAAAALAAGPQSGKGEAVVIKFGKDVERDTHAQHSGSDLLFLVPADLVRVLRELDLRDRAMLLTTQPAIATGLIGAPALVPVAGILAVSPVAQTTVTEFDPAKVKELKIAVRSPFELRQFTFVRKDKSWVDQTGLMDFTLDTEKVQQFVEQWAKLGAARWVALGGGPKTDQYLDAKTFKAKIELVAEDGRTATILVGGPFEQHGYFGHATTWPEAVFLIERSRVEPLLSLGVGWFAKQRVALGP